MSWPSGPGAIPERYQKRVISSGASGLSAGSMPSGGSGSTRWGPLFFTELTAFDTANARLVGLNIQLVYDLEAAVAELLQPVEFMHKALPGHLFAFYRYISGTPIEGTQGVEAQ